MYIYTSIARFFLFAYKLLRWYSQFFFCSLVRSFNASLFVYLAIVIVIITVMIFRYRHLVTLASLFRIDLPFNFKVTVWFSNYFLHENGNARIKQPKKKCEEKKKKKITNATEQKIKMYFIYAYYEKKIYLSIYLYSMYRKKDEKKIIANVFGVCGEEKRRVKNVYERKKTHINSKATKPEKGFRLNLCMYTSLRVRVVVCIGILCRECLRANVSTTYRK